VDPFQKTQASKQRCAAEILECLSAVKMLVRFQAPSGLKQWGSCSCL